MQALRGSKRQKSSLGHRLYSINCFALGLGSLLLFKQVNVLLWVENIGETPITKIRVCSCSHTNIWEILPIGQVMTALVSWKCPIRDFVVLVTRCLQSFVCILVHISAKVFVPRDDAPFVAPGMESRAFLNNQ